MSAAVDMRRKKPSGAAKKRKAKVAALKNSRPQRATSTTPLAAENRTGWGWRGVGVGVALLAICIGLGVQVSNQSQQMRALYSQLQQNQEDKDALLAERSKLLLERGALNNYSAAETIARDQLDMRFPETITRVEANAAETAGQQLLSSRRQR